MAEIPEAIKQYKDTLILIKNGGCYSTVVEPDTTLSVCSGIVKSIVTEKSPGVSFYTRLDEVVDTLHVLRDYTISRGL